MGRRRRPRVEVPRRRQVVLRFSDAEFEVVRDRAALAGMAVGAWIGEAALASAQNPEHNAVIGLPDLIRLHADVVLAHRVAIGDDDHSDRVGLLLERLDVVIDGVVAAARSSR